MSTEKFYASSKSKEWFTPAQYLDSVRAVLGRIELDPASCPEANKAVRATTIYTESMDGLSLPWHAATVFLNPPYGTVRGKSLQGIWSQRFIDEYDSARFTSGILLVNSGIGDQWFRPLWRFPMCLVYRRIRFNAPGGIKAVAPTKGNAFVYAGAHNHAFKDEFYKHGKVVMP